MEVRSSDPHEPPPDPALGPGPQAPLLLCETCQDGLTADVLPGEFSLSGHDEACCAGCWPVLSLDAEGHVSRAAWDAAVASARAYEDAGDTENPFLGL